MNEIQIIRQQLATERQHFTEVAALCATALDKAAESCIPTTLGNATPTGPPLWVACADYFEFALTRLGGRVSIGAGGPTAFGASGDTPTRVQPAGNPSALLKAARAADATSAPARWREFLKAFDAALRRRFDALDTLSAANPLVTEWRAVSGIDADAIVGERTRYARVRETAP
jgi:hypothetical protein